MAEVAVNYLIEKLSDVARQNLELIKGAEDDVAGLVSDLQGLKAFLKDASKIDRNAEGWKQALKEIRVVVYKAEDVYDKFLVDAKNHQEVHKVVRWAHLTHWLSVKNVAAEIRSIRNTVNDLSNKYRDILEDARSYSQPNTAPHEPMQNLSEEDDVVGFDGEANTVIGRLIEGSKDLEAVPIVGMPGLGKSTLAKKVYKDSRIIYEFFNRVWVKVSRTYTKKDVLLNILTQVDKPTNEFENMTEEQMTNYIRASLTKGGRCLIILDDVWRRDVFDFIIPIFPKQSSNRIIVTTRQEDVATYFNANIHNLKFLRDDESWLLLKKKVFRSECCSSNELEEPGKIIATKCSGLPLAIVVITGALVGKATKKEWELVIQTIGNHFIQREDPNSCLGFIKMSYDLLSYDTKACFVYCAAFPQGCDIPVWKLIRLWIAEGFILYDKNLTLEEKAQDCLNDLTKKNLVMVITRTSDGQIKTCRIHDMLYEFCKREANNDDIFEEITPAPDQSSVMVQNSDIYRRICIDPSNLNNFLSSFSKKRTMKLVRSFLCFGSKQMKMSPYEMKTMHRVFPMIRVLEVETIKYIFTREFYERLHLKYVSLSGDFESLSDLFGNLWNLETIIINSTTSKSTFDITADIWSMLRLRHLHTNVPAKLPLPIAPTSKDCCIQTLSLIAPESCTREVFARACYLRKLGIRGDLVSLLDANTSTLNYLVELKRLENLKLMNDVQNTSKVITLPKLVLIFPKTLRKLTFSATQLEWSEVAKLGQIESLEVVKLKENAFKGDFWEPEIGGFSKLLVLWIERTDLKTWSASNRSFPNLKRLVLMSCGNLEAVPESFADIPNFQDMKLDNTPQAVRSARRIEEKKLERRASSSGVEFKLSVFPPDNVSTQ